MNILEENKESTRILRELGSVYDKINSPDNLTEAQKKEYELATFSAVFFTLTLFIAHRDLVRYVLPLVPFLFVAFSDILIKKEFKIALGVIIIPIFLYSLAFISQNVMPISNWAPFL